MTEIEILFLQKENIELKGVVLGVQLKAIEEKIAVLQDQQNADQPK